jgi:hypothetical protein
MAIDTATKPLREVDAPLVAEGGKGPARRGIQADQVAVAGAEENASIPSFRPVGDAAMHEALIGRCSVLPCLRVVYPTGGGCACLRTPSLPQNKGLGGRRQTPCFVELKRMA